MLTIHIMTATLTAGDAIGNYSRVLQRLLWLMGYRVRIYADLWDKHSICHHSSEFATNAGPGDILWYHFSIFSENIHHISDWKGITLLDYHGVTPPSLFHGYSDHLEELCRKARAILPSLIGHIDFAIAHSDYTRQELLEHGFPDVVKIPLMVETSRFGVPENKRLSGILSLIDYLLFVGRITPQKSIIELIQGFSRLKSRTSMPLKLLLVGEYSYSAAYVNEITDTIAELGLERDVILTDKVTDAGSLRSFYSHALFSVYLSHWETFCLPLVESMHHGVPVIGLARTAIPEILGDAGILLDNHDPDEFAARVGEVLDQPEAMEELRAKARGRADTYSEKVLARNIEHVVVPRFGHTVARPRVAFVVQRYGPDVYGGAEHLSRLYAEHLNRNLDIEVLTTCARDYHTWEDHYRPGCDEVNGIPVHRFSVETPRNMDEFTSYSQTLFHDGVEGISFGDALTWMRRQGPNSRGLIEAIRRESGRFDAIFFFTYLYGSTFFGLPLVRDKAILVPTAHNEPPIYLKIFRDLFRQPRGLVYLTEPERRFILRLYQNHHIPSVVTGVGIDEPSSVDPQRFRQKFGIEGPFMLYVGRIARSKGCQEMIDMFIAWQREQERPLKLVLIGKEMLPIPEHPAIRSLGFLDEQDKTDAIAAAEFTINPSPFESLSFSILESWILGTPTLVNARCDVLADHTTIAGGGLSYRDQQQFSNALYQLSANSVNRRCFGEKGTHYVRTHFTWDRVESELLNFLSELHNPTRTRVF